MFYRDTWIEINLDNFKNNLRNIKKKTTKSMFCVVKANAYGHGDIKIVKEAFNEGCKYAVVSSLDEALHLRLHFKDIPILCLGYVKDYQVDVAIANNITLTALSLDYVKALINSNQSLKGLKMHLKVDTGMNRLGMKTKEELAEAIALLENKQCIIEGIYTHFHSADNPDKTSAYKQRDKFKEIVTSLNYKFKWIHSANSDATLCLEEDDFCNAIRVGLVMYGILSVESDVDVKPVLSLYTIVTHMKQVKANETIGYGATYTCKEDSYIATLPIGYADGFIRANQGRHLYVDDTPYEVVGRVCMDQCMILTDKMLPIDTKVEIIGKHTTALDMANDLHTIPYEILCILSDRIPRRYIKNNEVIDELDLRNKH